MAGRRGGLGLLLLALACSAVGVGTACWTAWTLWRSARARSWIETPARVLEARLVRGSEETLRAEATYEYEFGGHRYRSTRVSFYAGSDNIGSFQQDVYEELSRYAPPKARNGREARSAAFGVEPRTHDGPLFRCYVDPDHPDQAVLYPSPRIEMVLFQTTFVLVFGGLGFGLVLRQLSTASASRAKELLPQGMPGQLRRLQTDWASGVVRADRMTAVTAIGAAAFWNLLSVTFAFAAGPRALLEGGAPAAVVLGLTAVGILLAAWAVRETAQRVLFGAASLKLVTVPAVVGGRLEGIIHLPRKVRAADGFRLRLECVRTFGDLGEQQEELWADENTIDFDVETDATRTAIPVQFDLPDDQPGTDPDAERPVSWRLDVTARNPGVDLRVRFDVPVSETARQPRR